MSEILVNQVKEFTNNTGVTVDGLLIKDGGLPGLSLPSEAQAALLAELYAARQEASEGDILAIIDGVLTFIESGPAPITGYSFDFSEFSDGAIPSPISGATWAISGGKAINTPAAGSNLLLDPGLENWNSATDLTSWAETANGSSSVNRDDSEQRSGTYCARLDTDVSLSDCSIQQNVAGQPAGRFVRLSAWHKATGGQVRFSIATGAAALRVKDLGAAYEKLVAVGITNGSSLVNQTRRWTGSQSQSIWVDDFVLELLTTSSVIFTLPETVANARVSAAWTIDQATIAGVVANVDDASNPQNFMLAYVRRDDGGNRIALLKCVAGTFSNVIAETAVTYVANAPIEIRKTGSTTYQLWYNGSQVGTDQTVSDAAIIDNKIHGALSTWEGNTLQSFFQSAIA